MTYQQIQLMESPILAESSQFEEEEIPTLSEQQFAELMERVTRGEVLSEHDQRVFEFNARGL